MAAADGPGADQAACASSFAASSAAIWTVFSAAPLRRLSLATKRTSPLPAGADWSARMRPTRLALAPAALSGVGTSSRTTRSLTEHLCCALGGDLGVEFGVDAQAVPGEHGHPHAGAGDREVGQIEDLPALVAQLLLFIGLVLTV